MNVNLFKKSFLVILCIAFANSFLVYLYSEQFFDFLDIILTWLFCFICVFGLFYIINKIYYDDDEYKNFIFTSIIPIIILTIIAKIFLILSLRILRFEHTIDELIAIILSIIVGIYIYIIILTLLARLIFKGFAVNYPVNNNFLTRLLKVLHIACLVADLTIIGAFFGIPIFLALWILQYVFANEKNPFFVFRKYNPKPYQEEDIIDVEVEDEKPKKSLKIFLENWKD